MAPPNIEAHYKELLNPIKDPEKSFSVNIAELLQDYLTNLVRGRVPPNFNSAALLLQGSSCIYGKKVEYIYNLANQLHQKLAKQQKAEQQNRKDTAKEKEKQKEEKLSDPFLCTEIKLGKNLSCLKRKNSSKNAVNKRPCKKTQLMKSVFVPVLLLALEDDEKGDVIFDTRGEIVGHKGDFVLNKCTLTSSGWLLLPTMNRDLVPSNPAAADYIEEVSEKEDYCDTDDLMPIDSGDPSPSLDEGLGTDPQSVSSNSQNVSPDGCSVSVSNDEGVDNDSPQSSTVPNSQNRDSDLPSSDQPLASFEGQTDTNPGLTPSDQPQGTEEQEANTNSPAKPASEGIENVPVLDIGVNDDDDALHPIRRSIRQALKVCQLEQQINIRNSTESLVVQKAIQKRNTRYLPAKLRMSKTEFTLNSTPEFCARTFFSMDSKLSKNGYCNFEMPAFSKNCNFFQRLTEKLEFLKSANRKNKKSDEAVDNENIEVDVMRDDDSPDSPPDTDFLPSHIDDADIRIENCPENNLSEALEVALNPEFPTEENPLAEDPPQKSLRELAQEQFDLCSKELQKFSVTTELSEAAREWEESIIPFLEEQEKRENFDIDVYGSRILNAFEDNNRKQSIYFRHFCKNMQKWEIHRYFMALLPLANIGNVAIDKERREDGSDDIIVTLLSRKMHHKELEEFGHSEGSHP